MNYDYFKKLYIEENKTIREISDITSLTIHQVKGRLRRFGIRKRKLKLGNELYDNEDWLYNEYVVKEKGYSKIASEQNVAYTTILDRINHFGWGIRGHNDIDKGKHLRGKTRSKEVVQNAVNGKKSRRRHVPCNYCESSFSIPLSKVNSSGNYYCDNKCFRSYLKENRIEKEVITDTPEYIEWRLLVYKRDGYRCKMPLCGSQTRNIHAHHIYPKRDYPNLVFEIDNGITLCRKCHESTYGKEYNYIDELVQCISNDVKKTE